MRVGGSAWEFKIDTRRLQDEKNNNFEDDNERITERKIHIWQGEGQQESLRCTCSRSHVFYVG